MPLETAVSEQSGLRYDPNAELRRKFREQQNTVVEEAEPLTEEEERRLEIIRYCNNLYEDARKARQPHETFDIAWQLYVGDMWPTRWPNWRAKITINKVRAFITFMQAVMTDNKPRLVVEPLVPGSEDAADLLNKLVDRDWDENTMQQKLATFVLYGLIWGTAFMKITYDPYGDGGRGKHNAVPIAPYNVFTNRTATCIEDAEFVIHTEHMPMGWVRRNFPEQAEAVYQVRGISQGDRGAYDRDYIREGDRQVQQQQLISAQNVDGNTVSPQVGVTSPRWHDMDSDTVEIVETWFRDESLESFERQKVVDGKPQTEPVLDAEGLYVMEPAGKKITISEIDGQPFLATTRKPKTKPVMETAWRPKFPNGRLAMVAAGRILLRDIPVPYQTDGFPFAMWKDYDVGAFWGQGEGLQLKNCAIAINRLASNVYEILEKTGNPSYKVKKDGGVNWQKITNKPGLMIPMDDMTALAPLEKPPPPQQFFELYQLVEKAMGQVSGCTEAVMGAMPAANTSFAAVDSLQESSAAVIRQKVRNMETGITRIGKLRVALIQQFPQTDRPIRLGPDNAIEAQATTGDGEVVEPVAYNEVQFKEFTKGDLQGNVEFSIVPVSSLSTSPGAIWTKFLTMYDKHIIDREWFHLQMRIPGWRVQLPRMVANEQKEAAMAAAQKDKKPGPTPKNIPSKQRKGKVAPPSHLASRAERAAVR